MKDLDEFVENTRDLLCRIDPKADCQWTLFKDVEDLKKQIDQDLIKLEEGDLNYLKNVYYHFLPTSTFQELYIDEKWEIEALDVSARMDELYARLRPIEKNKTFWDKISAWTHNLFR